MRKILLLCLVFGICVINFSACGGADDSKPKKDKDKVETQDTITPDATITEAPVVSDTPTPTAEPEKPEAALKKLTSFPLSGKKVESSEGKGIKYSQNGKYGFITADGTSDTGAVFTELKYSSVAGGILVSTTEEKDSIEGINRYGLLSDEGVVVIPTEYATIKVLNDQYAIAYEVTERTESKEECMIFSTQLLTGFTPGENDIMYKGQWQLYDVKKQAAIDGAKGTTARQNAVTSCYEGTAKYVTDDGKWHTINAKGEEISDKALLLENGSYVITDIDKAAVYQSDGTELFSYNPKEMMVRYIKGYDNSEGSYYAVLTTDEPFRYRLLDNNGNPATKDFDQSISDVIGPYITLNDKATSCKYLCDRNGNKIIEDPVWTWKPDEVFGRIRVETQKTAERQQFYYYIDLKGNVVCKIMKDDGVYTEYLSVWKKVEGENRFFSFKDRDFTVPGNYGLCQNLCVKHNADGTIDLIDTYCGETLFSDNCQYIGITKDKRVFVYAVYNGDRMDLYEYLPEGVQ